MPFLLESFYLNLIQHICQTKTAKAKGKYKVQKATNILLVQYVYLNQECLIG